jgi:hypothetical protein
VEKESSVSLPKSELTASAPPTWDCVRIRPLFLSTHLCVLLSATGSRRTPLCGISRV